MRGRVIIGVCAMGVLALSAVAAPPAGPAAKIHNHWSGSFTITFDQPMSRGYPVGADQVRTTPSVPLDCFWDEEGDLLQCNLPLGELPRATRVRVHLGPALRTEDGRPLAPTELTFETDPPQLQAKAVDWVGGRPVLELVSDIPLRDGTLDGKVVLLAGDRRWPLTVQPLGLTADGGSRFAVTWPNDLPADEPLRLVAEGTFLAREGDVPGSRARALVTFRVSVPPRLANIDCVAGGTDEVLRGVRAAPPDVPRLACDEGEVLRLRWTTRLDDASRARVLRALPAGTRAYFRDGVLPLEARELPRPGTELSVAGLRAGDLVAWRAGDALTSAEGGTVTMPGLQVMMTVPRASVVLSAMAMPPEARERALPRASDAPAFEMGWIGYDGALHGGRIPVPDSRGTARTVSSPEIDDLLARGGWVEWKPPLESPMRAVSWAPPFDVRLAVMRESIAVWAVPWRGDGVIADAMVELVRISESDGTTVVARGRTDAHGLRVLALPDGVVDGPRVRWAVQVHHEGRTASQLLDLDEPLGRRPREDVGAWLVTDRLVYRPGDTVHFAGWRRVRVDGEGQVPAAGTSTFTFKLFYREDGIEVPVRWDAEGHTHGRVQLPRTLESGDYCFAGLTWHAACVSVEPDLARTLWVDVARDAGPDALTFDVSAGTWAGAPPDARIEGFGEVFFVGWSPATTDAAWAGYTFLPAGEPDVVRVPVQITGSGDGRARATVRTDLIGAQALPLAGNLVVEGYVASGEDQYGAFKLPRMPWAPSPDTRYVGVRLGTPGANATREVDAVVVDAMGGAVRDAAITLEVRDADDSEGAVLTRCTLVSGERAACAWPTTSHRRLRVTAHSGDAMPSAQIIDAPSGVRPAEAAPPEATWSWRAKPDAPGAPAGITVHHGFADADVLAVTADTDGSVLAHAARVRDDGELVLPAGQPDASQRDTTWRVLVRERLPAGAQAMPRVQTMVVEVPRPTAPTPSPLQVDFLDGGRTLQVRNTAGTPIRAVVSVLDEASAVVAPWQWRERDPTAVPLRAAFDTVRYGVVAPMYSAPYGHRLFADRDRGGPLAGCTVQPLALPASALHAPGTSRAACAMPALQETDFWRETNRAEAYAGYPTGPHPWEPVSHRYAAPVAIDHAWPAGAPRGGDGHARFRAVLWEPWVTLAPGETRTFMLPVPTHPVHWVARAWTVVAPGVVTASDAHVAIEAVPAR